MVGKKKAPSNPKTKKKTSKAKPTGRKAPAAKSPRKKAASTKRKAKTAKGGFTKISVILMLWGVLIGFLGVLWFGYDLPSLNSLTDTTRRPSITVLARNGEKIATVGDYYAEPVKSNKLPKHVVNAFLATEDRRFFSHFGIDVFGIIRAAFRNTIAGGVVQGGSTITQQLAKNFLLTEGLYDYRDRSLRRKVQEVLLSFWLEYKFTKHQILTIYLNRVYFASGAFGLGAAAKTYFAKSPYDINIYESAMLAGMLKAPTKYCPFNDMQKSKIRTQQVLSAMLDASYITIQQRAKLHNYDGIKIAKCPTGLHARFFVDWILAQIPDIIGSITRDLVITTTLDQRLQKIAEDEMKNVLHKEGEGRNVGEAAMVIMTPAGSIRAMVGGRNYNHSQYNRAAQSSRQTGSVFKLFVYLAGLESGLTPTKMIVDGPLRIGKWKPKNYGWKHRGSIRMQDGLAYSVNTVAARIARYTGRAKVAEMASRLGISAAQPNDLTIALGSGDASLLEMTCAYAVVAREGYPASPTGVIEIRLTSGKIIYHAPPQSYDRLISASNARAMDMMLECVMNYGTGRNITLANVRCRGKSGTSQKHKDAWFIGYTDKLVAGVWVGNDDNSPMNKVTGATIPGKIWHNVMAIIH